MMVEFRILCPVCHEVVINSSARMCAKCAMGWKDDFDHVFAGKFTTKRPNEYW